MALLSSFAGILTNSSIPTAGLSILLDASSYSGSGTTWPDSSGNGRNFTWSSTPSYTSGAIPYFNTLNNGTSGPASNSVGITNSSGYTIFLSHYQNSLVQSAAFKFYSAGTASSSATRAIYLHGTWDDGNYYFDQGGCCAADTRTSVAMLNPTGAWSVVALRSNSVNERSIWQNGTLRVSNTTTPALINLTSTAINFGSSAEYGSVSSSPWNARVGHFIVYNRALSDNEIIDVSNYVKSRIGL
jgi:hypothetical protein